MKPLSPAQQQRIHDCIMRAYDALDPVYQDIDREDDDQSALLQHLKGVRDDLLRARDSKLLLDAKRP
jgi:hypothetical protein